MKKLITFATILLVANVSHAISFNWGINGDFTYFGSGNKVGAITATLVYLGENATAYSISDNEVKNPMALTSAAGVASASSVTTPPALNGKFNAKKFDLAAGEKVGALDTDILTAGSSTFGLYLTHTDGDGVTWYNVSSETYTIPGGATDITTGLATTFAFDWKKNDVGTPLTSGGGWTQVPEPSTAALALAGLALLIKRRRA